MNSKILFRESIMQARIRYAEESHPYFVELARIYATCPIQAVIVDGEISTIEPVLSDNIKNTIRSIEQHIDYLKSKYEQSISLYERTTYCHHTKPADRESLDS